MLRFAPANEAAKPPPSTATEEIPATAPAAETPTEASVAEANAASAEAATREQATTEETPETPATDDAADGALSHPTFTPEQQTAFEKRLGKEIAKTKALKEQFESKLAALEARVNAQAPAPEVPQVTAQPVSGGTPLAHINDPAALAKMKTDAMDAIDFVETTLETPQAWQTKTDIDPRTQEEVHTKYVLIGNQAYTEADLRASRRQAKATLERHIPERAAFLQQRQNARQQAYQKFPFLTDKTSPDYQMAQAAWRENTWLHGLLNADEIIATQIEGRKAIAAREAAAKAPAAPAKPKIIAAKPSNDQAAVSSNGSVARLPGAGPKAAATALRAKLDAKGAITADDAKSLLIATANARSSR